jgi:hypothetical protein
MKRLLVLLVVLYSTITFGQSNIGYLFAKQSGWAPPATNLKGNWDASISASVVIGTGVSTWKDQSGNSNDLVQATGGNQPTYSGSGTSSTITFDGTNDYLSVSFTQSQPTTIYIILDQVTWTSIDPIYDGPAGFASMTLFQYNATPGLSMNGGSLGIVNVGGCTLGTYFVVTCVWNGASSSISINDGTKTTGNCGTTAPGGLILGAFGGLSSFGNIAVKQVLYYSAAHDATTQTSIISGLRTKWGI